MKITPAVYILIAVLTVAITVVTTIFIKDTYFGKDGATQVQQEGQDSVTGDSIATEDQFQENGSEVESGTLKVQFTYPSEFLPGVRFCLTDVNDESKVSCYFQKGSYDDKTYANEYVTEEGLTVPVGQYYFDYAEYDIPNDMVGPMYRLNPCIKAANGRDDNEVEMKVACKGFLDAELLSDYSASLADYGGESTVVEIKAGLTTDVGVLSLMPYLSQ